MSIFCLNRWIVLLILCQKWEELEEHKFDSVCWSHRIFTLRLMNWFVGQTTLVQQLNWTEEVTSSEKPPASTQQKRSSEQVWTSTMTRPVSPMVNSCKNLERERDWMVVCMIPVCSSVFVAHINVDSEYIEPFVSSSIPSKSGFLCEFNDWTEL
jgi:hypothetical protein